ncbi:MAG: hypothetical protein ACOX02_00375 [Acholeplasmatales bacterium]
MAYEFVPGTEYLPVKDKLEKIIFEIKEKLESKYLFQPILIGSGSKKLITRKEGSNKGFDFDYNFLLESVRGKHKKAKKIREDFFKTIQSVSKKHGYKTEDSKTAITIKLVDQKKSRIVHSCDIGMVKHSTDENGDKVEEIIVRDKNQELPTYLWNIRPKSKNYIFKLNKIENKRDFGKLEIEYLKLKNKNKDEDKKSFQLFIEAINNLYNQYNQEK